MASYLTQLLRVVYGPSKTSFLIFLDGGVCAIGVSKPFCCSLLRAKPGVVLLQSEGTCHHLLFGEKRWRSSSLPLYCSSSHY